jgi:hypothetical protein
MEPQFPLRIIFDDGETTLIESPEEIFDHFTTVDSIDPAARIWIRDDDGRTVRIVMRDGIVECFELLEG